MIWNLAGSQWRPWKTGKMWKSIEDISQAGGTLSVEQVATAMADLTKRYVQDEEEETKQQALWAGGTIPHVVFTVHNRNHISSFYS